MQGNVLRFMWQMPRFIHTPWVGVSKIEPPAAGLKKLQFANPINHLPTAKNPAYAGLFDGERGIRTLGDISATFDFESSALDQLSHLSIAAERTAGNIMRTQR